MAEVKRFQKAEAADAGRMIQLVTFRLGSEEYGIDIMKVQEIIRIQSITRVPQMPAFIEGVINLRGSVIPVLDLRKRFEMEGTAIDHEARIVIVNVDGRTIGVVVDAVSEVKRLSESQIEPPPPVVAGIGHEYLRGVGKLDGRLIILLDLEKILSSEEKDGLGAL
jgi:purine-binding chemotaxis protein CheW